MSAKITATDEIPPHVMNGFAELLGSLLQGRGFCLVITPITAGLPVQYVANVNRADAHQMLEQMCQKWRSQS